MQICLGDLIVHKLKTISQPLSKYPIQCLLAHWLQVSEITHVDKLAHLRRLKRLHETFRVLEI